MQQLPTTTAANIEHSIRSAVDRYRNKQTSPLKTRIIGELCSLHAVGVSVTIWELIGKLAISEMVEYSEVIQVVYQLVNDNCVIPVNMKAPYLPYLPLEKYFQFMEQAIVHPSKVISPSQAEGEFTTLKLYPCTSLVEAWREQVNPPAASSMPSYPLVEVTVTLGAWKISPAELHELYNALIERLALAVMCSSTNANALLEKIGLVENVKALYKYIDAIEATGIIPPDMIDNNRNQFGYSAESHPVPFEAA